MTDILPPAGWPNVRQLETNEFATGGANGNMNEQAKSLAARSELLKKYAALPYESKTGGYALNERVQLATGDIVRSAIASNVNNPNENMTGWAKTNDASQIVDENGRSQQQWNNGVESIAELLAIPNPKDGSRVYAKGYRKPTNFALKTPFKGGSEFIYVAEKASENDGFIVYNGWVRQNVTTIKPEYNGAYGDGVTDDWEYLQKSSIYSILNKRELELDATTYFVSKPWYMSAVDFSLCQATETGNSVLATHQSQFIKIRGQGWSNTTIKGTGKHVVQLGNFPDDNYGQSALASWYGEISDFSAVGDGSNSQYAIAGGFLNHYNFTNIRAQGGVKGAWLVRRATWTPSLWCTFSNCRGSGGEVVARFECNSFTFDKRCFFGYGTILNMDIVGSRNVAIGLSMELSGNMTISPSFVRVQGDCEFISPDFEAGATSNARHAVIVAENSTVKVTMPTFIGVKSDLFKLENDNLTGRWICDPLLTQGRRDNARLDNFAIRSNKPLSILALPKWSYKKHTEITIAIVGTGASFSTNTTVMDALSTVGSSFEGALLPHVIQVKNTSTTPVDVRIGIIGGGASYTYSPTINIAAGATVYLDDAKLSYALSMYSGSSYIRNIVISYRNNTAIADGNLIVKGISVEAQNVI